MITRSALCLLPLLLLAACGGTPERDSAQAEGEAVPEITLNLPQADCSCPEQQRDYTFLEKGFNALQAGEYLESLQYLQRYQRIENTDSANLEARIAIAYLSALPDSPIYDREAAYYSYSSIRGQVKPEMGLHDNVMLMKDSLEIFLDMYQQVERVKQSNTSLRTELEKREEAIKRLRDLTLGREPEPAGLLGK